MGLMVAVLLFLLLLDEFWMLRLPDLECRNSDIVEREPGSDDERVGRFISFFLLPLDSRSRVVGC